MKEQNLNTRDKVLDILRRFKKEYAAQYGILTIGLFGSAARDSMNEASDIDVVVELERPDLFNLIGIKQDLEEQLDRPVDIVRYRERMNDFLKRRIDQEAVYV